MGLPPARVLAGGVVGTPGSRRRLSRFLRSSRAVPKKVGQFPPRGDSCLSVYANVCGGGVLLGLFVVRGGNSPIFSFFSARVYTGFEEMIRNRNPKWRNAGCKKNGCAGVRDGCCWRGCWRWWRWAWLRRGRRYTRVNLITRASCPTKARSRMKAKWKGKRRFKATRRIPTSMDG
ncbi:MAG: hypothetical protein BWX80_03688 [Candidatus Hydrogenedentes bacterium ADurb.Bin101]|nr:MAG: hypothetical protein BWX80_03688 [Candidatus Hydrogenedentes bacterium ADurb.Bin101]